VSAAPERPESDPDRRVDGFELGDYPPLARAAERVATRGQAWYLRSTLIELGIPLLAAVVSAVGAMPGVDFPADAALLAAALLLIAGLATTHRRQARTDRAWFEGRAVAESAKTVTWRYMMRVPPFDEDARADAELAQTLRKVGQASPIVRLKVARETEDGPAITERMRQVRATNWQGRRAVYLAGRLDDQITWYGARARYNATRSGWLFKASLGAQALAVGVALVRTVDPRWNLVGVFTTLSTSVVAWGQAKRFDELQLSYLIARDELAEIRERVTVAATEAAFVAAVVDSEGAISREHTSWAAKSGAGHIPSIATSR